jgi:hypothetical protein
MNEKRVSIPEEVYNAVMNYLTYQPLKDVYELFNALKFSVKKIETEPQENKDN